MVPGLMTASPERTLAPRRQPLKRYPADSTDGAAAAPAADGADAATASNGRVPPAPALDDYGSGPRPAWLDTDWGAYERQLRIGGQSINFVDVGEGPAIVFAHGWFGRWQHWLDSIEPLARSHRVIAVDLPGFGASEMPPEGVTIPGAADTLLGLLDELGIESAALVGSSMGGAICVEAALQAPARAERLGLVAATGLADGYIIFSKAFLTNPIVKRSNLLLMRESSIPKRTAVRIAARPRLRKAAIGWTTKHPERLSGAICVELLRGGGCPGGASASASLAAHDFRPRLGEIECPTLLVWGEDDLVVGSYCAERYAELIPHARVVTFADTGHLPMIERPGRFLAELERFLDDD